MHRHDTFVRTLAGLIHTITGTAVHIERRVAELSRICKNRMQEAQPDIIVASFTSGPKYLDVVLPSPVIANQHHLNQSANRPGYAATHMEYKKRMRYTNPNLIPFAVELGGRPGPSALRFIRDLFRHEGADRETKISDAWSLLSTTLQSSVADQILKTHNPPTVPQPP